MAHIAKRRKLSNGNALPSETTESQTEQQAIEAPKNSKDSNNKDQRRSLFVRSLPKTVTTEQLAEHFSQSYPLKHATVVLDKATGLSRGFGFVTFTDADDAQNAVNEFNNSTIDGRKIKVEVAEARNREVDDSFAALGGGGGGRTATRNAVNVTGQELRAKRQESQQQQQDGGIPPKLIVRNLPWSIKTSDDLAKLFLSYGKVKHAVVPKLAPKGKGGAPQQQQQQAGFGIVILRGRKNAEKALQGVNGKEVDGRVLAVDWAVDKETWEKVKGGDDVEDAERGEAEAALSAVNDGNEEAGIDTLDTGTSSEGSESVDDAMDDLDVQDQDQDQAESMDEVGVDDDDDDDDDEDDGAEVDDVESAEEPLKPSVDTSNNDTTIFIRNLPYTADDDSLYSHFKVHFGPVRYARVVYDHDMDRSRGTAFVSFYSEDIARDCVKNAPKHETSSSTGNSSRPDDKKRKGETLTHSLLQNEMSDPSGKYTLEGRVLQVTRALPKPEADRRAKESSQRRSDDKRRLFLLSEGTIPRGSPLYNLLGKTELAIREASAKQRQKLVKDNANLGLSLTRLSVRNIPRHIDSKMLKALAREAVVGFASDAKAGKRQPLSREEVMRGGDADREAEHLRKQKGRGVVKQVKIVYESEKSGSKVGEGKGGRSRGYGFVEYYGHRNALMGLRWLNGHLIKAPPPMTQSNPADVGIGGSGGGEMEVRNKRLIVEFAIENAQVVLRRAERERKRTTNDLGSAREGSRTTLTAIAKNETKTKGRVELPSSSLSSGGDRKRKFGSSDKKSSSSSSTAKNNNKNNANDGDGDGVDDAEQKNKTAARNRIIAQKRMKRKKNK